MRTRNLRWVMATAALMMAPTNPGRADAAFTITFDQRGGDVVATGTGTFNLANLRLLGNTNSGSSSIGPQNPSAFIGAPSGASISIYTAFFANAPAYGTGGATTASSGTGGEAGFSAPVNRLIVPASYNGTDPFTVTSTYNNKTFATLGLAAGTYNYAYYASADLSGGPLDTITIIVPNASVPEPASLAMMRLGLAGMGFVARKQRRA